MHLPCAAQVQGDCTVRACLKLVGCSIPRKTMFKCTDAHDFSSKLVFWLHKLGLAIRCCKFRPPPDLLLQSLLQKRWVEIDARIPKRRQLLHAKVMYWNVSK